MKVDITLEVIDHGVMKFNKSETPLKEFQKMYPGTTKGFMISYMEKYNMVYCTTFHNFLNVGPIIQNMVKNTPIKVITPMKDITKFDPIDKKRVKIARKYQAMKEPRK